MSEQAPVRWHSLWQLLKQRPGQILGLIGLLTVEAVCEAFGISLILPVVEKMLGLSENSSVIVAALDGMLLNLGIEPLLPQVLGCMVAVFFVRALTMHLARSKIAAVSADYMYGFQGQLVNSTLRAPLGFFSEARRAGVLNSFMNEVQRATLCYVSFAQLVAMVLALCIYSSGALLASGALTLVTLATVALVYLPLKILTNRSLFYGNAMTEKGESLQQELLETFSAIKPIKANAKEPVSAERLNEQVLDFSKTYERGYFYSGAVPLFSEPLGIVALVGLLALGQYWQIAVADMLLFLLALYKLIPISTNLLTIRNTIAANLPSVAKISNTLAAVSKVPGTQTSKVPGTQTSKVPGTQTSKVPGTQTSKVPGTQTSKVPGTQTSKVPGTQTSKVPGTQTSKVPGTQTSKVPGTQTSKVPGTQTSKVPGTQTSKVPGTQTSKVPGTQTSKVPGTPLSIQLNQVTFGYAANQPVLRDVSLTLERGKSLAVVGPSGGGKTTLVDLVMGFYRPQKGVVQVMGRSPDSQDELKIAYVCQNASLFRGTLRQNLTWFDDRLSSQDGLLWSCLEAAQMADTVRKWPQGLDTLVGEKGASLSGGQRQRLTIARALMQDPELLIFDEATSSLDDKTQLMVTATLEKLMAEGRYTIIMIAHRLSTVERCDQIIKLEGGEVVFSGSPGQLLQQGAT